MIGGSLLHQVAYLLSASCFLEKCQYELHLPPCIIHLLVLFLTILICVLKIYIKDQKYLCSCEKKVKQISVESARIFSD